MITKIHYKNFKALRDATLPLGRFTLIVGANGTGKSTALQALKWINNKKTEDIDQTVSTGLPDNFGVIEIKTLWDKSELNKPLEQYLFIDDVLMTYAVSAINNNPRITYESIGEEPIEELHVSIQIDSILNSFEIFSFNANKISQTVSINSEKKLKSDGGNLAGILDLLKDSEPERWKELNDELARWFPEFDQILFDRNDVGKYIVLRTKMGKHKIKANNLSDGTRLALAYLTLAYLPNPPKIVAFEEPEHGIHPRLLENIQEAMYRLAYPEHYGEKRDPVQVIATTHSPYLLDLYKEHPEEIVIASKDEKGVHFERLIDQPHFEEVIQDAPLGEIWYTGVLGGVPIQQ